MKKVTVKRVNKAMPEIHYVPNCTPSSQTASLILLHDGLLEGIPYIQIERYTIEELDEA